MGAKAFIPNLPRFVCCTKTVRNGNALYNVRLGQRFTGGKPERRSFASKDAASSWVEEQAKRRSTLHAAELTPEQIADALLACKQLPPGKSLLDMVKFYKEHAPSADVSLRTVIDEYLANRSISGAKSYVKAQKTSMEILARGFPSRNIAEIEKRELCKWMENQGWHGVNLKNYLRDYGMLFRLAVRREYLKDNPLMDSVFDDMRKKASIKESKIEIYTPAEAARLVYTAYKTHATLGLLWWFVTGLFMGVRTEEMKRLKKTHILYGKRDRYIAIDETVGKKRHIRNIDFTETFGVWLAGYQFANGNMWNAEENDYISKTNLRHRIAKLHDLAKVPFKKNALRHSAASYFYVESGSIDATRKLLGHDSPGVIYSHYLQLTDKDRARQYWDILPPYLLDDVTIEEKQKDVEYRYEPKERVVPPIPAPRKQDKDGTYRFRGANESSPDLSPIEWPGPDASDRIKASLASSSPPPPTEEEEDEDYAPSGLP